MWSNTFLSHLSKVAGHGGGGGETNNKKGPAVRYSAIPNNNINEQVANTNTFLRGPQVFLDLDVEDTVTCFCRFVFYFLLVTNYQYKKNMVLVFKCGN